MITIISIDFSFFVCVSLCERVCVANVLHKSTSMMPNWRPPHLRPACCAVPVIWCWIMKPHHRTRRWQRLLHFMNSAATLFRIKRMRTDRVKEDLHKNIALLWGPHIRKKTRVHLNYYCIIMQRTTDGQAVAYHFTLGVHSVHAAIYIHIIWWCTWCATDAVVSCLFDCVCGKVF